MQRNVLILLLVVAAVITATYALEEIDPCAGGKCPVTPSPAPLNPGPQPPPKPGPSPSPCPRPRSAAGLVATLQGCIRSAETGPHVRSDLLTPEGQEIACDFPAARHKKNRGGSDGSGLCVFCSMSHAGDWCNDPAFSGIFEWMFAHPGGGYPEKVDQMIQQMCGQKSLPKPPYIQVEGSDLAVLQAACRQGFMPGVTYSVSPTGRYGGKRIAHMVNLVHADERWFGVLDNNYPGTIEWMDPETFRKSFTGGKNGWAVLLLADPIPPAPWNEEGKP